MSLYIAGDTFYDIITKNFAVLPSPGADVLGEIYTFPGGMNYKSKNVVSFILICTIFSLLVQEVP